MKRIPLLFMLSVTIVTLSPASAPNHSSFFGEKVARNNALLNSLLIQGIKEKGLLREVEDAGYPFVVLTVEFPERGFSEYFNLNLEEVKSVNAGTLSGWIGRYIAFEYTSEIYNVLLDLRLGGKSILDAEGFEMTPETKTIAGTLSGCEEETPGDLPGMVFIATEEEYFETFPFYITDKMVEANGKQVVGYFEERTQNSIIAIKVLPR